MTIYFLKQIILSNNKSFLTFTPARNIEFNNYACIHSLINIHKKLWRIWITILKTTQNYISQSHKIFRVNFTLDQNVRCSFKSKISSGAKFTPWNPYEIDSLVQNFYSNWRTWAIFQMCQTCARRNNERKNCNVDNFVEPVSTTNPLEHLFCIERKPIRFFMSSLLLRFFSKFYSGC